MYGILLSNFTLDAEAVQWKIGMAAQNHNTLWARLKRYSLLGWIRHFRLLVTGKRVMVTGSCLMCGRCCQRISLESGGRWLRTEKEFATLVGSHPEFRRFTPAGCDSQGFLLFSCSWYAHHERGCRDYENRLQICRQYPDTDLYFTGGEMPADCGYTLQQVVPFAAVLSAELEKVDDVQSSDTGR